MEFMKQLSQKQSVQNGVKTFAALTIVLLLGATISLAFFRLPGQKPVANKPRVAPKPKTQIITPQSSLSQPTNPSQLSTQAPQYRSTTIKPRIVYKPVNPALSTLATARALQDSQITLASQLSIKEIEIPSHNPATDPIETNPEMPPMVDPTTPASNPTDLDLRGDGVHGGTNIADTTL